MKVTILAVGKLKEKYLKTGISEYQKRLSRFCSLEIVEVEDEKAPESLSEAGEAIVKQREGERILKKLDERSKVIVLDIKGEKLDSVEFARKIQSYMTLGSSSLIFVIGGSLGLDDEVIKKADLRLSLSDMTFPHQLARLIILEQIYRAFKIINNEPYHR